MWFDEAISAWFASLSVPSLWDALVQDVNPPLYYLLLHLWLPLGQGDGWLRLPSALCGTATVIVTALLGRALFGARVGALAGLFTALTPFLIDMSQEARAYALLSLLASASRLLLVHALRVGGWYWPGYALVTTLALYTHNYAFFLVLGEAVYLALAMVAGRRWQWWPWLALGLVGVLLVPWLPTLIRQVGTVRGDYWIAPPYQGVLWDTYAAFISYTPPEDAWASLLLKIGRWLILGLLGVALASAPRHGRVLLPVLAVATPVAAGLLISWWLTPLYVIRYVSFVAPAFWVVVARGLDLLPAGWLRWPLGALVAASVAINLPPLYGESAYGRSDLRGAAELVRWRAVPGDLVVHTRGFSEAPFAYYNRGRLEETLLPEDDPAALRATVVGRVRFWYVRDFGLLDPGEAMGVEADARRYLADWPILEHHRLHGVHLFLLQGPG